jgi:hypothetical protein
MQNERMGGTANAPFALPPAPAGIIPPSDEKAKFSFDCLAVRA